MKGGLTLPELQPIADFINSVGFPVFAVCLFFWQNHKSEERHAAAEAAWRDALANNTDALHGVKEELARRSTP